MSRRFQIFAIVLIALLPVILLSLHTTYAKLKLKLDLRIIPNVRMIHLGSEVDKITLIARVNLEDINFKWNLIGPGTIEGDRTTRKIYYIPPNRLSEESVKVLITVTIADDSGDTVTENIEFLLAEPPPTVIPTPVPVAPSPVPERTPRSQQSEHIAQLLDQADTYFKYTFFILPEEGNAFDTYKEVLRRDPANYHAKAKIREMAALYRTWGDSFYEEKDYRKARKYYQRYLVVAEYVLTDLGERQIEAEFQLVKRYVYDAHELRKILSFTPTPAISLEPSSSVAGTGIGMVTGSKTGTYIKFGLDIAEKARLVGVDIEVKESEGSIDNIERLVSRENAAFAIVQSDVLGFLSRSDDPAAQRIAKKLRVIFPFYNEEVHLFANKKIQRFEDLQGKRVVLGTKGSGNWLTAKNLLDITRVEPDERMYLSPVDAVEAVLMGYADAMFYVVGKPGTQFTNLNAIKAEYPHLIERVHFVPLDDPNMLQQEYVRSEISSADYAWFGTTIPTIAVKAVLICFDFSSKRTSYYRLRCQQLSQLGQVIRANIDDLKRTGHPKWQEVNLDEELDIWELDACSHRSDVPGSVELFE